MWDDINVGDVLVLITSYSDESGKGNYMGGVKGSKEHIGRRIREGDDEVSNLIGGGFVVVGNYVGAVRGGL